MHISIFLTFDLQTHSRTQNSSFYSVVIRISNFLNLVSKFLIFAFQSNSGTQNPSSFYSVAINVSNFLICAFLISNFLFPVPFWNTESFFLFSSYAHF